MHRRMVIGGSPVLRSVFLLLGVLWGMAKAGSILRAERPIPALGLTVPSLAAALLIWRTAR